MTISFLYVAQSSKRAKSSCETAKDMIDEKYLVPQILCLIMLRNAIWNSCTCGIIRTSMKRESYEPGNGQTKWYEFGTLGVSKLPGGRPKTTRKNGFLSRYFYYRINVEAASPILMQINHEARFSNKASYYILVVSYN